MFLFATHTCDFEGKPLTTVTYRGRPAWVARQIGAMLGYSGRGKRLVSKVLGEWNSEFQEGHDYAFLAGEELAAFKQASAESPVGVSDHARHTLLVLFEPGLHLVLTKTRRPVGVRLRRFLADEVLPQLVRDGRYDPDRRVGDLGVTAEPGDQVWTTSGAVGRELQLLCVSSCLAERREQRLHAQARTRAAWVELCDRRFRVQAIHRVLETLAGVLDDAARIALEVTAGEIATGLHVESLLDDPPASPRREHVIDAPQAAA